MNSTVLPAGLRIGDALPSLSIAISTSDIVSMSLATRDFHPVHHDPDVARSLGHPRLFINTLATSAIIERFVLGWSGRGTRLARLAFKLGVAQYAGETLVIRGEVAQLGQADDGHWAEITFTGNNPRGLHASGRARVIWA